jgi:hypothetical protein
MRDAALNSSLFNHVPALYREAQKNLKTTSPRINSPEFSYEEDAQFTSKSRARRALAS